MKRAGESEDDIIQGGDIRERGTEERRVYENGMSVIIARELCIVNQGK